MTLHAPAVASFLLTCLKLTEKQGQANNKMLAELSLHYHGRPERKGDKIPDLSVPLGSESKMVDAM